MGGRSSGSARAGGSARISNEYSSRFGFKNVGNLVGVTTLWGSTVEGTVAPKLSSVQEYFDSGAFDRYGTNAKAKKQIVNEITRDMHMRGYKVSVSEDKSKILLSGNTEEAVSISNKDGKWVAKQSRSSGITSRGGMKGALDRTNKR